MQEEGGGCLYVVVIAAVIAGWLWWGNGWATVRTWTGHATLEDQQAALAKHLERGRIGSAGDVWLVKGNFGVPDRVALFFGYLDDWDTCYEFAQLYMQRYPADTYTCQYAN